MSKKDSIFSRLQIFPFFVHRLSQSLDLFSELFILCVFFPNSSTLSGLREKFDSLEMKKGKLGLLSAFFSQSIDFAVIESYGHNFLFKSIFMVKKIHKNSIAFHIISNAKEYSIHTFVGLKYIKCIVHSLLIHIQASVLYECAFFFFFFF